MLDIRAEWNTREVRELATRLNPKRLRQGLSVAVNTTARQVRVYAVRLIVKESSISRKQVDGAVRIHPFSNPDTLSATVRGRGKKLSMKEFKPRETRKGVTATVWGKRQYFPGLFINAGWTSRVRKRKTGRDKYRGAMFIVTGHRKAGEGSPIAGGHVFGRKDGSKRRIEKKFGAGISETMANDAVSNALETTARERLRLNVLRQLDRYVAGAGGRGR